MLQSVPLRGDLEVDWFCIKENYFLPDIWKMKCSRRVYLSLQCKILPVIKNILLNINYYYYYYY